MAGKGPPPKDDDERRRRNEPERPWHDTGDSGWQHGEIPPPPAKLTKAAREAWAVWFGSWFAAFWTPADLPGLRQLVRLYDQVERGEFQRHGELRLAMDTYGITPKGQQDRRWRGKQRGDAGGESEAATGTETPKAPAVASVRRLRAVDPKAR